MRQYSTTIGAVRTARKDGERRSWTVPRSVAEVLRTPGEPLDRTTRDSMESRFRQDFSHVRVHTGRRAAASAVDLAADAYSFGPHVVFAPGRYEPATTAGQRLLAHELTHVAQQGRHRATALPFGVAQRGHPAEVEAETIARASSGDVRPNWSTGHGAALVFRQEATSSPEPDEGEEVPAEPLASRADERLVSEAPTSSEPLASTVPSQPNGIESAAVEPVLASLEAAAIGPPDAPVVSEDGAGTATGAGGAPAYRPEDQGPTGGAPGATDGESTQALGEGEESPASGAGGAPAFRPDHEGATGGAPADGEERKTAETRSEAPRADPATGVATTVLKGLFLATPVGVSAYGVKSAHDLIQNRDALYESLKAFAAQGIVSGGAALVTEVVTSPLKKLDAAIDKAKQGDVAGAIENYREGMSEVGNLVFGSKTGSLAVVRGTSMLGKGIHALPAAARGVRGAMTRGLAYAPEAPRSMSMAAIRGATEKGLVRARLAATSAAKQMKNGWDAVKQRTRDLLSRRKNADKSPPVPGGERPPPVPGGERPPPVPGGERPPPVPEERPMAAGRPGDGPTPRNPAPEPPTWPDTPGSGLSTSHPSANPARKRPRTRRPVRRPSLPPSPMAQPRIDMKYRLGGQYRLPARRLPGDSKKMARQSVRDDPDFMAKLRDLERQRARNPVHNPERIAFEDKVADALAELRQVSSVDLAKEAAKNEAKAATYRRKSMELKKANPAADTSHYVESAKQYSDLARMQREAPEVIRASHQHMYKAARVVNTCLTDVDLLIEVVDDIIAQAKTIKRSGARPPYDYGTMSVHEQAIFDLTRKSNRHAKIEVIPKGPSLGDSEFFQEWVTSGKRLYDLNIDDSHGRTTHLIQDLMVDRAFRRRGIKIPGSDKFMTAEEYRRRLGDLVGLDPTGKHLGQRLWEYSYDAYLSLDDPNALFPVLRGKLPDLQ